jgi:FMN phosphatase YigB (HAD superfamily)
MFAEMAVVFLLDVDNTLIDNDAARERMSDAVERILGPESARTYWAIYEEVRNELGFVDSLEALSRFHERIGDPSAGGLDRAILDFPYTEVRYPDSLRVLETLWSVGTPVVLSDGDPVFQPLKIARAGLTDAVHGNVLVFMHKEEHLYDVARLFPADHYVAVDDKAAILGRIKLHWEDRVRTVHVLQGKYADDPNDGPPPDAVIQRIGDLVPLAGTRDALRVFMEEAAGGLT